MTIPIALPWSGFSFSFEQAARVAKELAEKEYQEKSTLPESLASLTYDQFRAIRTSKTATLWKEEGLPFRLEFFHPGYLFQRPVKINLVTNDTGEPVEFPFDPGRFDYSKLVLDEEVDWSSLDGYAGFRILHPLHGNPKNFDEIGSFLGASYFRLLGEDQRYGLSARGLAIDVARSTPEEFPDFVEYWIVEPKPGDTGLKFYALLDSPSVTGAYRFVVQPGTGTTAGIRVKLFFRKQVASVGLAPLTSMFWYGENSSERFFPDWRPEVHDSDGLLFRTWNDEVVWRPLFNHSAIRYSHFIAPDLQGFGLMQRDRDFSHYQDLSNPYHQTPTAWIEPADKWGKGAVRLVELPTENEANDNVVAFYEPEQSPSDGESLEFAYALSFLKGEESGLSPERAVATRVGVDPTYADTRRFVIDFDGPALRKMRADAPIFAEISSSANGYVNENQCFKNVMTGGWRVEFKLDTDPGNKQPVELRCILRSPDNNKQIYSETWSYLWTP